MARSFTAAGVVLAVLAALAEIGSFTMEHGGIISRTVMELLQGAERRHASAKEDEAKKIVSVKDRCRKTAVIRLDAECVADSTRSEAKPAGEVRCHRWSSACKPAESPSVVPACAEQIARPVVMKSAGAMAANKGAAPTLQSPYVPPSSGSAPWWAPVGARVNGGSQVSAEHTDCRPCAA